MPSHRLQRLVAQVCASYQDKDTRPALPFVDKDAMDMAAIQKKYDEERIKREENSKKKGGTSQYPRLADLAKKNAKFAAMLEDPYMTTPPRAALNDDIEVAILGAGYGGLVAGARLREAGVEASEIRLIERAGDTGGTWYWNRYPGAMCDVEALTYMPLCEELTYVPTERYCAAPEIMAHSKLIAEKYGLYEKAIFATNLSEVRWDEAARRWIVSTDKGDKFRARHFIANFGTFTHPKLPAAPGIEDFEGHMWHTSRWDYGFTGGSSRGGLTRLADKNVGIIGTGATAIQCIPHLGEHAKHLYVFQRTPSTVDVRNNHAITPEFAAKWCSKPGWQRERVDNFTKLMEGGLAGEKVKDDTIQDGWTAAAPGQHSDVKDQKGGYSKRDIAEFHHMERVRARIPTIVKDPQTAAALTPWYKLMCKRPTFHDDYLPTFNRPNVTLVDTNGQGVDMFTKKGVVVQGKEYPCDCLCLATGFETSLLFNTDPENIQKKTIANGFQIFGVNGQTLEEKWANGPKTLNSYHTRGFPNLFLQNGPQAALSANFTTGLEIGGTHIAHMIGRMRKEGKTRVEAKAEAEEKYCAAVYEASEAGQKFYASCTPGYYNNEGSIVFQKQLNASFPNAQPGSGGTSIFIEMRRQEQRENRAFDDFELA